MNAKRILVPMVLVWSVLAAETAGAQGFRVYTRVYHEASVPPDADPDRGAKPEIIARSLSLFHAGKVYDYIHSLGEVIVSEPAHRRFTILNTTQSLATVVEYDELKNLLKVARHESEIFLDRAQASEDPTMTRWVGPLRFQLNPEFEEHYDPARRRLTLASRFVRYEATCADAPAPEIAEHYLRYADSMCQLNFVLHKSALFPESRLALNEALRRHGGVPTEVELQADLDGRLHLRAQHEIHWELDARDRSLIHDWESLLKGKTVRWVSFHEYQRTLLARQSAGRK